MNTNRRKFLHTSALGIVSINLYGSLNSNNSFLNVESSVEEQTIPQLLREAAIKRKNGDIVLSKQLYQQIITLDNSEIRAYDGMRKTLLLEKYKELEVLQLYSNGYNLNPNNPVFQERLSKEYMRLSLGNKKFVLQLNNESDLLELAKSSFNQLRNNYPDNIQYDELFKKAKRKLNQNANIVDARENNSLKDYKKDKRDKFKKRFNNSDVSLLDSKLSLMLSQSANSSRTKHIKELYRIVIKKYSKLDNAVLACQKARDLYFYDDLDVNSLRVARRFCKKHKQFGVLEVIERQNLSNKNTFWSNIGLFDCLLKRFNKEGVGSYNEMNTILIAANGLKFNSIHVFEIESRKLKLYLINNESQALIALKEFGNNINGISSAHYIDRYNVLCVKYFKKTGDVEKAGKVLNIALNEMNKEPEDDFLKLIYFINLGKDRSNPIHFEKLNKLRTKLMSNEF